MWQAYGGDAVNQAPSRTALIRALCRNFSRFIQLAWEHVEAEPYRHNWHIDVFAAEYEKIFAFDKSIERAVFNMPPSMTKSMLMGVMFPAWVWSIDPARRFIRSSFDIGLCDRDARKLIKLCTSPWYVHHFGAVLPARIGKIRDFSTIQGGGLFSNSPHAGGTGRHCHHYLIDDPLKTSVGLLVQPAEVEYVNQWLTNTVSSRGIASETFTITVQGQRIISGDLFDHCLGLGYYHLSLPMRFEKAHAHPLDRRTEEGEILNQPRFSAEWCTTTEKNDLFVWSAQYQQRPEILGGTIIKRDWLPIVDSYPADGWTLHSWDMTFKGDHEKKDRDMVAGGVIRVTAGMFTIIEVVNERMTFIESLGAVRAMIKRHRPAQVLFEDKANGPALENVLREQFPGLIDLVNPMGGKIARLQSVATEFALQCVQLARGAWNPTYIDTMVKFPRVKHDDVVDMTSQALLYMRKNKLFKAAMAAVRERH